MLDSTLQGKMGTLVMRKLFLPVLGLVWLTFGNAAFAQERSVGASGVAPRAFETAAVIVDGRILFSVRGLSSYPAAERARSVRKHILAVARDERIDPESIEVVRVEDHFEIRAGSDTPLIRIFNADAEVEAVPLELLASSFAIQIRHCVEGYRKDRSSSALRVSALYFIILTAALVLLIWGLSRFKIWMGRVLKARVASDIKHIERKSRRLIHREQIFDIIQFLLQWLHIILLVAIGYFYVHSVLGTFPWTRGFARILLHMVMTPVDSILKSIVATIPNLIFLLIIFLVFRFVLRGLKLFFNALGTGRIRLPNFEREWATTTYRLARIVLIAFGVVVAYPYIPGSDSAAFKGVSLFLGLIFSLGSTSFISNMMAGLTMTYRGAYREGDWVRIGNDEGQVEQMRMMIMRLRTRKNESITIPNSAILNSNVTNYSSLGKSEGLIVHTEVGIGYDTPWQQVEAFLLEAARRTEDLKSTPQPFVLEKALGDFAVTYEINAFCKSPERLPAVYAELHRHILDVFNENEVQIMSPAYVADPSEPKIAPMIERKLATAESVSPAEAEPGAP
jgi:small-conductance mechanosensitive channel